MHFISLDTCLRNFKVPFASALKCLVSLLTSVDFAFKQSDYHGSIDIMLYSFIMVLLSVNVYMSDAFIRRTISHLSCLVSDIMSLVEWRVNYCFRDKSD